MKLEELNYEKSKNGTEYIKIYKHLKHSFIITIKFDIKNKLVTLKKQMYLKNSNKFLKGMPISLEFEEIKAIYDYCFENKIVLENYQSLRLLCKRWNYKMSKISDEKNDFLNVMNGIKLKKGDYLRSETLVFCYRKAFKNIDVSRYYINKYGDKIRNFEVILRPEDILVLKSFCEKRKWR